MESDHPNTRFANDTAIFEADITALKLAINLNKGKVDTNFLAFHHGATNAIRRTRIRLLDRLNPDFLSDIVQKWAALYEKYFIFLLAVHSRQPKAPPVAESIYLEGLGLTERGLSCLPAASRYAEYWAESAVHDKIVYDQWQQRLDYIGCDEFSELHNLRESDEILAYDRKGLALPIFDISRILQKPNSKNLWRIFLAQEAHLVRLSETGARRLEKIFGKDLLHPGDVRATVVWARRVLSLPLMSIRFTSQRMGVIGCGYIISGSPHEIYLIERTDVDYAYFIMQSLRSKMEFRRIIFHQELTEVASAVFPNQRNTLLENSGNISLMLEILEAANHSDGHCRASKDYYCLDEWFFRGEDYSYRNLKAL